MKKMIISLVAVSFVILAVAVAMTAKSDNHKQDNDTHVDGSEQTQPAVDPNSRPNTVIINSYKFGPNKLTVKKGTKITWINNDKDRHNIKPDKDSENFKASPLLAKGEEYSFVFNSAGTYEYHCTPHPYMKASIEVTE